MINRKILSQKRVVLVGLLFALRTSIVLADPAQSGNTVDRKVPFEGSSKLKSESGREAPSSLKKISGEVINITQPRKDNAMPQLGQGTPFDRDEVEEDEESISLDTNGDEKVKVETSSPTTQFNDNKDGSWPLR